MAEAHVPLRCMSCRGIKGFRQVVGLIGGGLLSVSVSNGDEGFADYSVGVMSFTGFSAFLLVFAPCSMYVSMLIVKKIGGLNAECIFFATFAPKIIIK